jgi:hypothetical protein
MLAAPQTRKEVWVSPMTFLFTYSRTRAPQTRKEFWVSPMTFLFTCIVARVQARIKYNKDKDSRKALDDVSSSMNPPQSSD